jgi:stage III sporulation protein AG
MTRMDKERWKTLWKGLGDKKSRLLMALGIGGMLLILLSSLVPGKKEQAAPLPETAAQQTAAAYAAGLESELAAFISKIEGAGETKVLVMLENNGETRYLRAENSDRTKGGEASGRDSYAEEYVLVDGADGRRTVAVSVSEPEIRGVAVICRGGDQPAVQARILETVTTLLDISSARVSISRLAE